MNLPATLRDGGVQFGILVQPRASRNEIVGIQGERLKIRLTSPPVEGAANKSCLKFLAKTLGVSPGRVSLTAGETGRNKTIHIDGLSLSEFQNLLKPFLKSDSQDSLS